MVLSRNYPEGAETLDRKRAFWTRRLAKPPGVFEALLYGRTTGMRSLVYFSHGFQVAEPRAKVVVAAIGRTPLLLYQIVIKPIKRSPTCSFALARSVHL